MSARDQGLGRFGPGGAHEETPEVFIAACRVSLQREMPVLLADLFAKLDAALHELADKSDSKRLYNTYCDALRIFLRQRSAIESRFLRKLEEVGETLVLPHPAESQIAAGAQREKDLALAGHGELEETLAVANLISKAENRYGRELLELRHNLALLIGLKSIDSRVDPLGPYVICTAFKDALEPVEDVNLATKLVAYKLFDKCVMDQLGAMYARSRECLHYTGVETQSRLLPGDVGDVQSREKDVAPLPDAASDAELSLSVASCDHRSTLTMFAHLQHLLGRRRPEVVTGDGGAVVDTGELVSALSALQTSINPGLRAESDLATLRLKLRDNLLARRVDVGGFSLARSDEDTLDLVYLLFETMFRSDDLPDTAKTLLSRLQISIAKVALVDKSFFDDSRHPARRLLNHLADLSIGWIDDGDRSSDGVNDRIERIVTSVLNGFDRDLSIFAELDAELGAAVQQEREEARIRESRARRELEGQERDLSARATARAAIAERLRDHGQVPEVISTLLYEGWQEVLVAAYLRSGTGGIEWADALATVDRLLWSLQPKIEYSDRRELLRGIPELLRTMRESLTEVAYDKRHLARWFKELRALHILALRGAASSSAEASGVFAGDMERSGASREVRASGSAVVAVAIGASVPVGITIGTWIEIRRDDDGLMRVKLAWRSPETDIHLFVGRGGRKALELSGQELASLIELGVATVLRDGDAPLVDRAMESLLQSLRAG